MPKKLGQEEIGKWTEELDTLAGNGLEPKDVNKYISAKVREMFFEAQKEY